jgi:hypothetical protein
MFFFNNIDYNSIEEISCVSKYLIEKRENSIEWMKHPTFESVIKNPLLFNSAFILINNLLRPH